MNDYDIRLDLCKRLSAAIMDWQHAYPDVKTNDLVPAMMTTLLDITIDFYRQFSVKPTTAELAKLVVDHYNRQALNA